MVPKKIVVMRIGHRPKRDVRITTHVALVARAFGADGFVLEGEDFWLRSVGEIIDSWGGSDSFKLESTLKPKQFVKDWKNSGGIVVHLTMYGLNLMDREKVLRSMNKQILIIVGAGKVEQWYYENSDYNIAVGNQPHSEVAATAIFLDRMYKGKELLMEFGDAKLRIIGQKNGKQVIKR